MKKMFFKYKNAALPLKAAFWFSVCSIIQQAVNFLTVPLFTRILSSEEYGIWTLYQSWQSILNIIVGLNLASGGFNSALIKYEDRRNEYVSSMVGLLTMLCLIWWCVSLYGQNLFIRVTHLKTVFLYTMYIDIFLNGIYTLWAQQRKFEFKYKAIIIITIFLTVVSPLLSLCVTLHCQNHINARILSNTIVNGVIIFVIIVELLKSGKKIYNKQFWLYALSFNIPLIPHYLSQIILNQSDRIMIANMCGDDLAAYYSIAYSIAAITTVFVTSIMSAFCPWLFQKIKTRNIENIHGKANILAILFALLSIGTILVGPEVLNIMGPIEYQQAKWVIPPVSASIYFLFLYNMYANIEFYFEKKKMIAVGSMIAAISNIILNYLCIRKFGYIAAGYTTLICNIIYTIGHYTFSKYIQKTQQIKLSIYNERFLWGMGIIVSFFAIISNILYMNNRIRYIFIGIFIVIGIVFRKTIIRIVRIKME